MSIMLVNVSRPPCISYLLSHPLLSELISDSQTSNLEYYISMVKTLALRMDESKVALLFNQV